MNPVYNTEYKIQQLGSQINYPSNPISKLKYYLNTIYHLLHLDLLEINDEESFRKIIDYNTPCENDEQFKIIVLLAIKYDPKYFIGKCIFINNEMLQANQANRIYQLSQLNQLIFIRPQADTIQFDLTIKRVMICKDFWLVMSYYQPLKIIENTMKEQERKQRYQAYLQIASKQISRKKSHTCCCQIM